MQTVSIHPLLWQQLVHELRERGENCRESGAFLLARPDEREITAFVCFDDLDPHCLKGRYIEFSSEGFSKLWEYCKQHSLEVIADVHTHPATNTRQSWWDMNNPMIVLKGHTALIIPSYAQGNDDSLDGVGAYCYEGNKQWSNLTLTSKFFTNGTY